MQRRVLAIGGLVAVLALTGCMGFLTGEPLVFRSDPAVVPNSSAAESGFVLQDYNETEFNETVEVMGVQRKISISFHRAVYTEHVPDNVKEGDVDRAELRNGTEMNQSLKPSLVTIVSVPDAQFMGQSVNPLVRLPTDELIKRFGSTSEGNLDDLEKAGEQEVSMLGSKSTLAMYNGSVSNENGSSNARISMAKTAHEGDVVILVAVQPDGGSDGAERLSEFAADIEHPAEKPD